MDVRSTPPPAIQSLLESEERLRSILETCSDYILVLDCEGTILYINRTAEGFRREDVTGTSMFDYVPPGEAQPAREAFERVLATSEPAQYETRGPRNSKEMGWYSCRMLPQIEDGRVHQVTVWSLDITERKNTELSLRESAEFSRAIVESSMDGILTFDLECRYTAWNGGMERISGMPVSNVVGRIAFEVFPFLVETGEDRAFLAALEGKTSVTRDRPYVIPGTGKQGWFEGHYCPLRDAGGGVIGGLGVIRDITERKETQDALRGRARRQAVIAELGQLALAGEALTALMQTMAGRIAETLGVEMCDVLEWSPDRKELTMQAGVGWREGLVGTASVGDGKESQAGYTLLSTEPVVVKDLRTEPRFSGPPLLTEHGVTSGLSVVIRGRDHHFGVLGAHTHARRDFTRDDVNFLVSAANVLAAAIERRRADEERADLEKQLLRSQKLESLGVLAGGIAHDFNNLLTGVLGNASLALADLDEDSAPWKAVADVEKAARSMAELSKQMLAFSGKGQFVIERVDLSTLTEDMAQLLERVVSKNAELRFELREGLPAIEGDRSQLEQVIMNLITNASDALEGAPGTIAIRTGSRSLGRETLDQTYLDDDLPEGDYVFLEVADTGCGMDAATMAKIFDPFFSTKETGHGLGLAALLGIVRGHRGAVEIDCPPEGGTVFRVFLPASEPSAMKRSEREAEGPAPPAKIEGGVILVVEDEPIVRNFVVQVLQRAGFQVVAVQDGIEAVERFKAMAENIALVLLDLTLPGLNGYEVFDEIQRIRSQTPIILSSGYTQEAAMSQFGRQRIASFIHKPYAASELIQQVQRALGE